MFWRKRRRRAHDFDRAIQSVREADILLAGRIRESVRLNVVSSKIIDRIGEATTESRTAIAEIAVPARPIYREPVVSIIVSILIIVGAGALGSCVIGSEPSRLAVIAAVVAVLKMVSGTLSAASKVGARPDEKEIAVKVSSWLDGVCFLLGFPALIGGAIATVLENFSGHL